MPPSNLDIIISQVNERFDSVDYKLNTNTDSVNKCIADVAALSALVSGNGHEGMGEVRRKVGILWFVGKGILWTLGLAATGSAAFVLVLIA